MSAQPETLDYDATLARLNTEQNIESAADEGGSAHDVTADRDQDDRQQDEGQDETRRQEAPPPATEEPTEEVRLSKREVEEMRRQLASYGANLQQQRSEFDQRLQQAIQGQGPDLDRRIADARREERRTTLREQIGQISDPALRTQYQQTYEQEWQREDQTRTVEQTRAESEQIRQQAQYQTQQAQTVIQQAQAQAVAVNMPTFLEAYAPIMANRVGQELGSEVDAADVKAFLTRPEIVKLAQAKALKGPQAINELGDDLATLAAAQFRDRAADREKRAEAARQGRNNSGQGRQQGGANGGTPPADLGQYRSAKGKPGDFDAMLAALNKDQGIETVAGRRR